MENLVSNAIEETAGFKEMNILFQDMRKSFTAASAGFSPALFPEGILWFSFIFFLNSILIKVGTIVEQLEKSRVNAEGYEKQNCG